MFARKLQNGGSCSFGAIFHVVIAVPPDVDRTLESKWENARATSLLCQLYHHLTLYCHVSGPLINFISSLDSVCLHYSAKKDTKVSIRCSTQVPSGRKFLNAQRKNNQVYNQRTLYTAGHSQCRSAVLKNLRPSRSAWTYNHFEAFVPLQVSQ